MSSVSHYSTAGEDHSAEVDLVDSPPHMSTPHTTSQLLLAARMLTGSTPESTATRGPLSSILSQRLMEARAEFSELSFPTGYTDLSTKQLESATGYAALKILEAVDVTLLVDAANQGAGTILLGAKDKQVLRTTASLVLRWALDPILNRLSSQWKGNLPTPGVSGGPDIQEAAALLRRLYTLVHLESTKTPVSDILTGDHSVETLRGLLMLGWLPPGVCTDSSPLRAAAMKVLGRFVLILSVSFSCLTSYAVSLLIPASNTLEVHYRGCFRRMRERRPLTSSRDALCTHKESEPYFIPHLTTIPRATRCSDSMLSANSFPCLLKESIKK